MRLYQGECVLGREGGGDNRSRRRKEKRDEYFHGGKLVLGFYLMQHLKSSILVSAKNEILILYYI